jgi:predicted lipoprotein with Yx(FWY)xxD motif
MQTTLRSLILGTIVAILVAACSSGGATPSPSAAAPETPAPASEPPASEAPASEAPASEAPASAAAGGAVTVMVADSSLGQILVDSEGRTLYMFKPDEAGTPTCYDDCETNWPPLTVTGDVTVGEGLDASLFTTVARTDGSMQVKAGTWPLYYFKNDAAPGDTNGQEVGDVWYVVSPTGEPIES